MNGPVIPPHSSPTNAKNKFRPSPPFACCSLHAEISLLLPPPSNPFPRHGGVGWSVVGWAGRTLSDFAPTDLLSANKRRRRRRRRRRAPLGKINMQRRKGATAAAAAAVSAFSTVISARLTIGRKGGETRKQLPSLGHSRELSVGTSSVVRGWHFKHWHLKRHREAPPFYLPSFSKSPLSASLF